jgi:acyl-coenzyme A synthetase/AMP-(fatty) acid ligase
MKGYWNASRDTEAAFVKHSDFPGKKLYRTGDMVILDKEGNYVFAGRTDSMVKRKGYRIELKEIQAALYGHPGVLEAAASVYTDTEGEKRIQAEVVCRKNKSFSEESLRAFCLRRLPVYMVPDAFVFRRSLPRTSTGKLIAASGVRRRSRWED